MTGESDKYLHWFDVGQGMGPLTKDNAATFFVTGKEAFQDIGERIEVEAAKDATFYLLGWSIDKEVKLQPGNSPETLSQHLTHFDKQGGAVYAMIWRNAFGGFGAGCQLGVDFINSLGRGRAILDFRTPLAGTHHQKMQAIAREAGDSAGVVAWCGGMDLYPDRIGPDALHDVHCKVIGPGADELVNVFLERWNDHPSKGSDLASKVASKRWSDRHDLVQVCRTYPSFNYSTLYALLLNRYGQTVSNVILKAGSMQPGEMRDGGQVRYYNFYNASQGVQQVWRAVKKAIDKAQRYIYLEDQYLVNEWVGDYLADKLKMSGNEFRIVILALHPDKNSDIEQMWSRRRAVLARLSRVDPGRKRWQIYARRRDRPSSYVHSKTWIFDDELLITGSANADRRGFTYNTEANVVVAGDLGDKRISPYGAITLAQDLRCRLFAMHLGGAPKDYLDSVKGLQRWFTGPQGANVERFNASERTGSPDKYVKALNDAASGPPSSTQKGAALVRAVIQGGYSSLDDAMWDFVEDPDSDVPEP
jgi:phosphatidylserine/phosphatidylglycerophosphate/cardiolipin synthase-like enzyme